MMNPVSAAPVSVRRQALMEQLRLLERSRQAQQHEASLNGLSLANLPTHLQGGSIQDILLSQDNMIPRERRGSIGGYESILRIDDMSRLQAAMRRSSGMSLSGPLTPQAIRGISSLGMIDPSKDFFSSDVGVKPLDKMSSLATCNPFGKISSSRDLDTSLQNLTKPNAYVSSRLSAWSRGSFPMPSVRRAKKAKNAALLSYKVLWANPNVRSPKTRKELFSRRISKNKVAIMDKSGELRLRR